MWLTEFILFNAKRFYSSKGDPLGVKGLVQTQQEESDKPLKLVISRALYWGLLFYTEF